MSQYRANTQKSMSQNKSYSQMGDGDDQIDFGSTVLISIGQINSLPVTFARKENSGGTDLATRPQSDNVRSLYKTTSHDIVLSFV